MVKTRSSTRVVNETTSAPPENGNSGRKPRARTGNSGQRPRKNCNSRNGQVGPGGGNQGKDPLAPLPGARAMYQHPSVTGYNSQDSRTQSLTVTACNAQARQSPIYHGGMYHGYGGAGNAASLSPMTSPSPTPLPNLPVYPDVKFKRLPFYDVMAELLKPSTMIPMQTARMQEGTYIFHLTPQQTTEIACSKEIVGNTNKIDFVIQAQLRFCLLETSCEQEDHFPPSVSVKVNNKMCPLPNPMPTNKPSPEPKRPPRPVNITSLVKLSPTVANTIHVSWASDFTRAYVLSVFLVKRLTPAELLQRLKNKGTKNPDYTRALIKEKLSEDEDNEIATTSLRVSLMCPLGKKRMVCPCRPSNCPHLQCFDASLFIQMNERRPTWTCPVCDRPALYESLVVDGYFQEVLTSPWLPSDCTDIQMHADGSWSVHVTPPRAPQTMPTVPDPVTLIPDDLEIIPIESTSKRSAVGEKRTPKPANSLVDLTSDSDEEAPLKRKAPQPKNSPTANSNDKTEENTSSNASEVVSSSGYRSPSHCNVACGVISLDSPSPTAPAPSPTPAAAPVPSEHQNTVPPEHGARNEIEREENETAPSHWAPYADAEPEGHIFCRRY